jgi:uncharacterized protein (TIGR02996 family)
VSATLRYDLGVYAALAIDGMPDNPLGPFGASETSRWAGVGRARWLCVTFAVKLPAQASQAFALLKAIRTLAGDANLPPRERDGCQTLAGKLSLALGLPPGPATPHEDAFLHALAQDPGQLATWSAYADWLQERPDPQSQRRGLVIAGWLARKPMKVKYGVPTIAKP